MKRVFLGLILTLALALPAASHAQTLVALPTPTVHGSQVSWQNTCPTTMNCEFGIYRASSATCPAQGAVAWTLLNTTAANATSYQDLTAAQGSTYQYVVVVQATINGTLEYSAPSNCAGDTIPNGPSPATGLTVVGS